MTPVIKDVTITLGPDAAAADRCRLTVTSDGETIYTRSTKFDPGYFARADRYMRDAKIYRDSGYEAQGDTLVARGRFATYE